MTLPTQHVEGMLDSCLLALRTRLNLAIDELNGELGTDLENVPPSAYYVGGLASSVSISWPFVELSVSDANYDQPALQQAQWNARATAYASIWCRHVDDEALYRATLRYGRALLAVLLAPDTFGDELWVDAVRVMYRRNPEAAGQDQALEACALVACTIVGDDVPS